MNIGEWATIRDMQVFYSHGAAKGYVRRQKNAADYQIVERRVAEQ
jgi:hypothetical protein